MLAFNYQFGNIDHKPDDLPLVLLGNAVIRGREVGHNLKVIRLGTVAGVFEKLDKPLDLFVVGIAIGYPKGKRAFDRIIDAEIHFIGIGSGALAQRIQKRDGLGVIGLYIKFLIVIVVKVYIRVDLAVIVVIINCLFADKRDKFLDLIRGYLDIAGFGSYAAVFA